MACESWQRSCRGNADSQGAKYISTPSYKNREHNKGGNAYGESHGVAGGEGAGAPAPTAAGSSMSILYRAWPWAWGKGCPSPRHVSEYPEVEGRRAGSTGANRLNCPSTSVGAEPRGFRLQSHAWRARVATGHRSQPRGSGAVPEDCPPQQPGQQH